MKWDRAQLKCKPVQSISAAVIIEITMITIESERINYRFAQYDWCTWVACVSLVSMIIHVAVHWYQENFLTHVGKALLHLHYFTWVPTQDSTWNIPKVHDTSMVRASVPVDATCPSSTSYLSCIQILRWFHSPHFYWACPRRGCFFWSFGSLTISLVSFIRAMRCRVLINLSRSIR